MLARLLLFGLALHARAFTCPAQGSGYALAREGAVLYQHGTEAPIVARLAVDAVLAVECDTGLWCSAQDRFARHGYLPSTAFRRTYTLDSVAVRSWMEGIFHQRTTIGRTFMERYLAHDSLGMRAWRDSSDANELPYAAAMERFTPHYCATGDEALLRLFFTTILADRGSAAEEPTYRLVDALECRPDDFHRLLATLPPADAAFLVRATGDGIGLQYPEGELRYGQLMKLLHP